ncbi:hypothetical protein EDD17DRAFT_1770075 [Pisolithus thermaeus]|nr:hypothetical protein EV401DRAFT_1896357 [Pisolithus croceorrhizus]KAI6140555.1 hypothetical protein EDD17DRAFT_1770075 [Pisolithus thermaeus]
MQQVEPHILMVEVGETGGIQLDKRANALEAPDERCQCMDNEVAVCRDLPESNFKAFEPVDDNTGQTGGCPTEHIPLMPIEENQRSRTHNETIANIPDPPSTHSEPSTLQIERPTLLNRSSARKRSAMTTEFDLSYTRTNDKLQEAKCLELDSKRALRRPKRTHRGHSTWDTPPNEVWGMGVHRPNRAGRGYSMDIESKTTKLEIRTISTNMVESQTHLPHLERHPKEPDKGDIGSGYNNAVSRDIVNLCSIEKAPLNDRERQHSECEMKKLDDLPASHKPPPNTLTHAPTTFMDPRHHGRIRTSAERVSGTHTSQITYLTHVVPLWLLCGTEGTYLECTMAIPSPCTSKKTCPNKEDQDGERETSLQLQETRRPPPE